MAEPAHQPFGMPLVAEVMSSSRGLTVSVRGELLLEAYPPLRPDDSDAATDLQDRSRAEETERLLQGLLSGAAAELPRARVALEAALLRTAADQAEAHLHTLLPHA